MRLPGRGSLKLTAGLVADRGQPHVAGERRAVGDDRAIDSVVGESPGLERHLEIQSR